MDYKQKAIESSDRVIETLKKKQKIITELIPDGLPVSLLTCEDYAMTMFIPYDPEKLKVIDESLCEAGWIEEGRDNITRHGDLVVRYSHPQIPTYWRLSVWLESGRIGSTCVRRQIGTELQEVPVYEVTCVDGADEPW